MSNETKVEKKIDLHLISEQVKLWTVAIITATLFIFFLGWVLFINDLPTGLSTVGGIDYSVFWTFSVLSLIAIGIFLVLNLYRIFAYYRRIYPPGFKFFFRSDALVTFIVIAATFAVQLAKFDNVSSAMGAGAIIFIIGTFAAGAGFAIDYYRKEEGEQSSPITKYAAEVGIIILSIGLFVNVCGTAFADTWSNTLVADMAYPLFASLIFFGSTSWMWMIKK